VREAQVFGVSRQLAHLQVARRLESSCAPPQASVFGGAPALGAVATLYSIPQTYIVTQQDGR
jgi:hypothetical protein